MADVRKFYRYDEAAQRYFEGDVETLRQAIVFKGLPVLVEHNGGAWTWPDEDTPNRGEGEWGKWELSTGFNPNIDPFDNDGVPCTLSGWFYVNEGLAIRVDAGDQVPDMSSIVWLNEDRNPWEAFTIHGREWTKKDLWFLKSDLEEFCRGGQQRAELKPMVTRERNNLLRIIAGLCKEARIDLEGGSGASQIEAAVSLAGFDGPKERTIRDVLKDLRGLLEPQR